MAEDVLEELEFEALRASRLERFKLQLLRSSAGKRKRELSSLFSSSPDRLNRKIGKIMERYNDLARDRDALRLRSSDGERRREASPLTPTSCLTKCSLHGREQKKRQTSLVQHIYNDEALRSRFDIKMWVWVCQEFDVLKLTRKLAEEATESPCGFAEMNQLHRIIAKRLEGKRFLLVLDDVWDESLVCWTSLLIPLKSAAPGSKIVVTTRSAKVARMMAFKMHQLGYLTDTTSWSVCRDAALQDRDPSIIDDGLISIGKSVAAKCKGLPLAANAAGSVLSIAIDRKHWETVEQSDLWANNEVIDHTLPALLVSYNSLQKPLKHCFSYCSLFPKEYVFRKDKLVRLWLALGFAAADGESDAEDIACRYFDNLVERFFLQQSPSYDHNEQRSFRNFSNTDYTNRYVMHDLYHELSEYIAADEYSRIERFTLSNVNGEARHLSLAPSETQSHEIGEFHAPNNKYMNESQYPGLRTLLVVQRTEHEDGRKTSSIEIPSVLFKAFVCLRALDLSNTDMEGLPNSIGELIHLRYLSLENTKIKCLPESISSLFKLHTMNLKCCNYLSELPQGIKFLANLRHLELPRMDNWDVYMPCGISELINLQTMHTIKFTSDSGSCGIADLVNLDNLRGELCISGIENVSKEQIAREASMKNKGELRKLVLQWSRNDSMFANDASSVLDSLQPHPAL
uniref:Uncharacterized protein n=1 Tax=Oryza punctata TaxID=4537 RepID=A0A0E0KSS7_ORYPU